MSDRVRTGELLAAIGAVGLSVLLAFGAWFSYEVVTPSGRFAITGAVGARHLGWFALLVTALAAIAGVLFLVRVLTSETTERPMLQAPVAYAAALFALIVDLVRMLIFTPDVTVGGGRMLPETALPADIALGGWLGLAALLLLVVGTWTAMSDERKNTAASKARTEALLGGIPVRPAPPAGGTPESDADTVAQDEVPDIASEPASDDDAPSTGDPA